MWQVSLFLLPYLVQNVVCHGSDEARQGVQAEVGCVCMSRRRSATVCLLSDRLGTSTQSLGKAQRDQTCNG